MANETTEARLIVNVRTRTVHLSTCFHGQIIYLTEPLPLEQWPVDERDQLHACGNCNPTGWR